MPKLRVTAAASGLKTLSMDCSRFPPASSFREISGMEKLRGDFLSLIDDPKFSDVVIKVQNRDIHVHSSILACRSSYFDAMFGSDFREKNEGCVEISDFSADTIMGMLRFIYGGKPPELTCTSACELMKAADKYQLNELRDICEDFLTKKLDVDNALFVLYHADLCSFEALKKTALNFVSMNMGAFHNREIRYIIVRNSPDLAEEILQKIADNALPAKSGMSHLPSFGATSVGTIGNSSNVFKFGNGVYSYNTAPREDSKASPKSD